MHTIFKNTCETMILISTEKWKTSYKRANYF